MPTPEDIIVVQMQRPGIDGTGITSAEKAQLTSDVADALARLEVTALDDVPDVSVSGAVSGDALVYDGTDWVPGTQIGSIGTVYDHTDASVITDATSITAKKGLTARAGTGANAAVIEARLGTSGTSEVLARDDHDHDQVTPATLTFVASGTLSGGSRSLVSGTVTGLDSDISYSVGATVILDLRGEGAGAGYHTLTLTINGNVATRPQSRTVSGVDREVTLIHNGTTVSGVTSVAVSASLAYDSGDPVNVGAGRVTFNVKPWR